MSTTTNHPQDENADRNEAPHDEEVPIPILTSEDLAPEDRAELDMWQALWEQDKASDEEFARVIERVYTRVFAALGIEAATLDEAMIAVRVLRWHVAQKRAT